MKTLRFQAFHEDCKKELVIDCPKYDVYEVFNSHKEVNVYEKIGDSSPSLTIKIGNSSDSYRVCYVTNENSITDATIRA